MHLDTEVTAAHEDDLSKSAAEEGGILQSKTPVHLFGLGDADAGSVHHGQGLGSWSHLKRELIKTSAVQLGRDAQRLTESSRS